MPKPFRMILALLLLAMPAGAQSAGPSFDCARASLPSEHAICADASLAALDRALASAYGTLRDALDAPGRARLLEEQKQWIGDRNDCGRDTACLADRMRARTEALEADTMRPSVTTGGSATGRLTGVYCRDAGIMGLEQRGDSLRFDFMFFNAHGHSCGVPVTTATPQGGGWGAMTGGCALTLTEEAGEIVIRTDTVEACQRQFCGARALIDEFRMPLSARQPWPGTPFDSSVGERRC